MRNLYLVLVSLFFLGLTASLVYAEGTVGLVKAYDPEGKVLDIKAFDKQGKAHNVKLIEDSGSKYILDIKAFINGVRVPVKIIVGKDGSMPIKAIMPGRRYL